MRDIILPIYADHLREVFLAEISDDELAYGHPYDLGDDHGYFICEADRTCPLAGVEILGKTASYEAALRLAELYSLRLSQQALQDHQPTIADLKHQPPSPE
jgi:hypothetical protein